MPKHTDRGLLFVHEELDGTISLSICSKVVDGKPVDVYAQYHHAPQVKIDRDVVLTPSSSSDRYTDDIVEVFTRGPVVTVRYPKYDDH
jgi:hypothetical protein